MMGRRYVHKLCSSHRKLIYYHSFLIHGHMHKRYRPTQERVLQHGKTTIINCNGKYYLDL